MVRTRGGRDHTYIVPVSAMSKCSAHPLPPHNKSGYSELSKNHGPAHLGTGTPPSRQCHQAGWAQATERECGLQTENGSSLKLPQHTCTEDGGPGIPDRVPQDDTGVRNYYRASTCCRQDPPSQADMCDSCCLERRVSRWPGRASPPVR